MNYHIHKTEYAKKKIIKLFDKKIEHYHILLIIK